MWKIFGNLPSMKEEWKICQRPIRTVWVMLYQRRMTKTYGGKRSQNGSRRWEVEGTDRNEEEDDADSGLQKRHKLVWTDKTCHKFWHAIHLIGLENRSLLTCFLCSIIITCGECTCVLVRARSHVHVLYFEHFRNNFLVFFDIIFIPLL